MRKKIKKGEAQREEIEVRINRERWKEWKRVKSKHFNFLIKKLL